jgi:uncharacterized protein (TIGR04255 family)
MSAGTATGRGHEALSREIRDLAYFDSPREFRHELEMKVGQAPKQMVKDMGLKGLRFRSRDQLQIVQLNRDGFVFSRLQPYEDWEQLSREAMRLWQFYAELARPTEIQRIGLRFINRMQLPPREVQFEDYIQSGPQPPKELELPFLGFMHHDTLAVPGYSYAINLIRTISGTTQPAQAPARAGRCGGEGLYALEVARRSRSRGRQPAPCQCDRLARG